MISPEMQPRVSEHTTPQKELITLPDRQVITAHGEEQKKVITRLIAAFNQRKSHVSKQELLGITKGIPLSPAQKEKLTVVVGRLRHNALAETGWNIQSITVNGKGVETRPNGYTLIFKEPHESDTPTLILQNVLGNDAIVKELLTDGPGKARILEKAKQQINALDPQEKVLFMEETFAILSNPDPGSQDKRDAALELLNIMDLKSIDPKKLKNAYQEALSNLWKALNQDSDPYGEIYMLLEAGKTIAPFIENTGHITQLWKRVAKTFTGDDHKEILGDIEEIRQLIPKTFSEFDTKVLMLVKKGLQNRQIATRLNVPIQKIQLSKSRLKDNGVRFRSLNKPERKPDKVH